MFSYLLLKNNLLLLHTKINPGFKDLKLRDHYHNIGANKTFNDDRGIILCAIGHNGMTSSENIIYIYIYIF